MENLHIGSTQREAVTCLGDCDSQSLTLYRLDKIPKCLAVVANDGAQHLVGGGIVQSPRKSADVVFMGVGADDIVQMGNVVFLQICVQQGRIILVAPVNEHGFSVADEQGGVCLPHVYEMGCEIAALGQGSGGDCRCGIPFAENHENQHQDGL